MHVIMVIKETNNLLAQQKHQLIKVHKEINLIRATLDRKSLTSPLSLSLDLAFSVFINIFLMLTPSLKAAGLFALH